VTEQVELDPERLDAFERALFAGSSVRITAAALWRALAQVFPHRTSGPAERRLLLEALKAIEARGHARLPSERGMRWDRSMAPAVPTSVDLVRHEAARSPFPWRTFPWHPDLDWVPECRSLSAQQIEFLRRVHEGLVNGMFREPAPLKYRSLQLTGDEKSLASLATTALFGDGRLTFEMLACMPDAVPLAWEAVGEGGRMVIFENAGPFAVARRVLSELMPRPYDVVAYGGGRTIVAALGHIGTLERRIESIRYVGDLDHAGLDIAWHVRARARALRLPRVASATELHVQMLSAAETFNHPRGWRTTERFTEMDRARILDVLESGVRNQVEAVLLAGGRIPEEVLGPRELRAAWTAPRSS